MHARSLLTALGIVGLVLTTGDAVSAATTGHPLLLGRFNGADATTTLRTTASGPPLRLSARPGQAPLAVGSTTKVTRLNADLLDGRDSSSFAPATTTTDLRYTVTDYDEVTWNLTLPTLPTGQYLLTYSVYMDGATGTTSDPLKGECYIVQGAGSQPSEQVFYTADSSTLSLGDPMSFSGSGVVDTRQHPKLELECELNEGVDRGVLWSTDPYEPIQVTITPLGGYRRTTSP